MSIAQSLVDIIQEEMRRHDAHQLQAVRLRIGKLSGVVPDALSFGFEVITAGTSLEGARLLMDIVPLTGRCRSCNRDFEIENYAFQCPHCQSPEIEVTSGQDLSIVDIEVD